MPSWQKYLEMRATGALDSGTTHPIWRRFLFCEDWNIWDTSDYWRGHLCHHQLWRLQQPLGRSCAHGDFWLGHPSERQQHFIGGGNAKNINKQPDDQVILEASGLGHLGPAHLNNHGSAGSKGLTRWERKALREKRIIWDIFPNTPPLGNPLLLILFQK